MLHCVHYDAMGGIGENMEEERGQSVISLFIELSDSLIKVIYILV